MEATTTEHANATPQTPLKHAKYMMRPRITQKEAAYIVQILEANIEHLKAKREYLEKLKRENTRAKYLFTSGNFTEWFKTKEARDESQLTTLKKDRGAEQ